MDSRTLFRELIESEFTDSELVMIQMMHSEVYLPSGLVSHCVRSLLADFVVLQLQLKSAACKSSVLRVANRSPIEACYFRQFFIQLKENSACKEWK